MSSPTTGVVDATVWNVVSRCPALLKQAEVGLAALLELKELLSAVAIAQSVYGQAVIKAVAKQSKALDAALTHKSSSVNRVIQKLKESTVQKAAVMEVESKFASDIVIPAIQKTIDSKQKMRQELTSTQEKKKRELDAQKDLVEKRRKDCVKQHSYMHEIMKKIIEGRSVTAKEHDPLKKEKLNQAVDKSEKILFNHKIVVRKMFSEFEAFVQKVNEQTQNYYAVETVIYMEKLRNVEIEKNEEVKSVMEKYVQRSKQTLEQYLKANAALEDAINALAPSVDASIYSDSPVLPQFEAPPPLLTPDLPCASAVVEAQADALLKGGIALKFASGGGASASFATPTSNSNIEFHLICRVSRW